MTDIANYLESAAFLSTGMEVGDGSPEEWPEGGMLLGESGMTTPTAANVRGLSGALPAPWFLLAAAASRYAEPSAKGNHGKTCTRGREETADGEELWVKLDGETVLLCSWGHDTILCRINQRKCHRLDAWQNMGRITGTICWRQLLSIGKTLSIPYTPTPSKQWWVSLLVLCGYVVVQQKEWEW